MCGNYFARQQAAFGVPGSPPRVRELLLHRALEVLDSRITPACAGITLKSVSVVRVNRDHPRVCGNYF